MPADMPTHKDLFLIGRKEMLLRNAALSAEVVDTEGSEENLICNVPAAMGTEIIRHLSLRYQTIFTDTARGQDADRLIYDHFQLSRLPASPSRGSVTFSRPNANGGPGTIPKGFRVASKTGVEYETDQDIAFAGATLSGSVSVTSVLQGVGTKVKENTITRLLGTPFDTTITVNNSIKTVGGRDAESDDDYVERSRTFFFALQKGTVGAVKFGCLNTPGVKFATVIEELNPNAIPAAFLTCYIADIDGESNAQLVNDTILELKKWRCGGIYAKVIGSAIEYVPITITLGFPSEADKEALKADVRSQIVAESKKLKPNETFWLSTISKAARAVDKVTVAKGAISAPSVDFVPSAGKMARTTADLITILESSSAGGSS